MLYSLCNFELRFIPIYKQRRERCCELKPEKLKEVVEMDFVLQGLLNSKF